MIGKPNVLLYGSSSDVTLDSLLNRCDAAWKPKMSHGEDLFLTPEEVFARPKG